MVDHGCQAALGPTWDPSSQQLLFPALFLSCRDFEAQRLPGPHLAWERQTHKWQLVQSMLLKKGWISGGEEYSREREGPCGP